MEEKIVLFWVKQKFYFLPRVILWCTRDLGYSWSADCLAYRGAYIWLLKNTHVPTHVCTHAYKHVDTHVHTHTHTCTHPHIAQYHLKVPQYEHQYEWPSCRSFWVNVFALHTASCYGAVLVLCPFFNVCFHASSYTLVIFMVAWWPIYLSFFHCCLFSSLHVFMIINNSIMGLLCSSSVISLG